ncbi:hypothetical protein [Methylocaldum sp.]|uniref:hypothetical protein n=1 Tax=Methylocaldum sp. TaxID=1969727 RepID=UPI002D5132D6|nr:hypothetical protein [Methylocaldum sp.]HYE38162.1 hypothetical protein [Methylocaldum sp.]
MATFPVQPGMADILDNPNGAMMAAPPQNPQEVEGRKKAWQHVLDDPNVKSSILRMGLNLLQGREQGESTMQAVGRTGLDAMDFYGFKTELDRKREIDERALQMDEKRTNASVARDESLTRSTDQQTGQRTVEFKEWESQAEIRKGTARQQYQNLVTQGKTAEAQALKAQFEADEAKRFQDYKAANPDAVNASYQATLDLPKAELKATNARANASNASAAASMENVTASKEGREATPAWIAALPDEEARLYAMANKDVKTQAEINADILAGAHKYITTSSTRGSADLSGFEGMADSLITQWSSLDPKEQSKYKHFDDWVNQTQQMTVGKSAGTVLAIAKQKLAAGGGASASTGIPLAPQDPSQRVEGQVYTNQNGQKAKWTGKGWVPQ